MTQALPQPHNRRGSFGVEYDPSYFERQAAEAAAARQAALGTVTTTQVPTRDASSLPPSSRLPGTSDEDSLTRRRVGAKDRGAARKALLG
jgi:hypothetical protein